MPVGLIPEIVDNILQNIGNDVNVLKNVILVNRSWCKLGIKYLWRAPFSLEEPIGEILKLLLKKSNKITHLIIKTVSFNGNTPRFFNILSNLKDYPNSIEAISNLKSFEYKVLDVNELLLFKLSEYCHNIEKISINNYTWDLNQTGINQLIKNTQRLIKNQRNLENLSIYGIESDISPIIRALESQSHSLVELTLSEFKLIDISSLRSLAKCTNLVSLEISFYLYTNNSDFFKNFIKNFTSIKFPLLKYLKLNIFNSIPIVEDLELFFKLNGSQLEELRLTINFNDNPGILQILNKYCNNLISLDIPNLEKNSIKDLIDFFNQLSKNLKNLSIISIGYDINDNNTINNFKEINEKIINTSIINLKLSWMISLENIENFIYNLLNSDKTLNYIEYYCRDDNNNTGSNARSTSTKKKECIICVEKRPPKSFVIISNNCNHNANICDGCVSRYIESNLNDKGDIHIKCPFAGCGVVLDNYEIKNLVNDNLYQRYDELALRKALQQMPDIRWCKNPKCKSAQSHVGSDAEPILTCRDCGTKSCFTHDSLWHEGLTCQQYDKIDKNKNKATQKYLAKHTKPCPKCGVRISAGYAYKLIAKIKEKAFYNLTNLSHKNLK
ncbi:5710_t:CDS:2 [Entrophospora sp. SA101]|nr:5710_t:CDS:2 [Entrophospora sp. SA101]